LEKRIRRWGVGNCPPNIMAKLDKETEITISIQNLIAIIVVVVTFLVSALEVQEELHLLQKDVAILQDDIEELEGKDG